MLQINRTAKAASLARRVAFVALIALSLGYGARLEAQACPRCTDVGEGSVEHKFVSSGGAFFKCDPNGCHDGLLPGSCGGYHLVCSIQAIDARNNLDGIERTVAEGDAAQIELLLRQYKGVVIYSAERRALQGIRV